MLRITPKVAFLVAVELCASMLIGSRSVDAQAVDNHAVANQLVAQFIAAQNTLNADLFDGVFTTNYIQHTPGVPPGLKGVKGLFESEFKQLKAHHIPLHVTAERIIVDGDRVVLVSMTKYKLKGKWVQQRGLDEWRIADGRFAEHWDTDESAQPSSAP
jgi:predicted SnoaL-like aldol condensation-catalyzing enzyme